MPCAWEAVSRLDEVCTGTFEPHRPRNSKNKPNKGVQLPEKATKGSGKVLNGDADFVGAGVVSTAVQMNNTDEKVAPLHLYTCDEHALCYSCQSGSNLYCNAILR